MQGKEYVRMTVKQVLFAAAVFCLGSAYAVELAGPEPYDKRLEYIQSGSKAYIDTSVRLTSDMKVTMVFAGTGNTGGGVGVFGSRDGAPKNNFSIAYAVNNNVILDFIGVDETGTTNPYELYRYKTDYTVGTKYKAEVSAEGRQLTNVSDGTVVGTNTTYCPHQFTMATNKTAYIFWLNGVTWPKSKIRLYSLVITRNGEVIYDYIPCLKGGLACLFERVHGIFPEVYRDEGAKTEEGLIAGPEVADPLPMNPSDKSAELGIGVTNLVTGSLDVWTLSAPYSWGATNFETYIGTSKESSDDSWKESRDYIDLGFKMTNSMSADVYFSIGNMNTIGPDEKGHGVGIFGRRGSSASEKNIAVHYNNTSIFLDFNNSDWSIYRASYNNGLTNTLYHAYLSKERRALYNPVTGMLLTQNTNVCTDVFETKDTVRLFGGVMTYERPINIYAVTIRDEHGAIIHDFKPAVKEGVTGLVDCVTMKMYRNRTSKDANDNTSETWGTAVPSIVKVSKTQISADGTYTVEIPRPNLVPETTYYYGLIATGGEGKDYATWGCEGPRSFTTKPPRGTMVIMR